VLATREVLVLSVLRARMPFIQLRQRPAQEAFWELASHRLGRSAEMLARAQKMTPIAAVQNRFNLLDRSGVQVLADCEAQGIMFVPYFPLASGRLAAYDELTGTAERLGATPAQVALAWILRRSPAMVVIPGTANPDHLRANIAAAEVAENLTDAEVARLTGLADESKAVLDQPHQSTLDAHRSAAESHR
jgi:pyridoxine 4-dehydrogenase